MSNKLNEGQKKAAEEFFDFLMSDEKEMIISGGGGYGKSFLLKHFLDTVLPEYQNLCELMGQDPAYDDIVVCATTKQAAAVLQKSLGIETKTIHSFLNLKVKEDFISGRTGLIKTKKWVVHQRKIIFIDECPMVGRELDQLVYEGTMNCKIVWVGDKEQLTPVMESLSPIYSRNLRTTELTQPVRNSGNQALMDLCAQLKETVKTGIFKPIEIVPGSIDLLDSEGLEAYLNHHYANEQPMDKRIVAYSNNRVVDFNEYIREIRGKSHIFEVGETLVNNSTVEINGLIFHGDSECAILNNHGEHLKKVGQAEFYAQEVDLATSSGILTRINIPSNRPHFIEVLRYYANKKDWSTYYYLKNNFPDLRPYDSTTVHKVQGGTYESILLDVGNISTCTIADQVARLLYVGVSRAKSHVYLYGNLKEAYGGLSYAGELIRTS